MVNQTMKMRYHGPKDLASLIQFYKETTGESMLHEKPDCVSVCTFWFCFLLYLNILAHNLLKSFEENQLNFFISVSFQVLNLSSIWMKVNQQAWTLMET